jgi:hypothetical protein
MTNNCENEIFPWRLKNLRVKKCSQDPGQQIYIFLVSWSGVRLSLLATSVTNWPIVPAPDDRWWWMWSSRWNENSHGKPKNSEKTRPSATLFTTNPTWSDLGSNPGRRGGKPATNRLIYGAAIASDLSTRISNFHTELNFWHCIVCCIYISVIDPRLIKLAEGGQVTSRFIETAISI